MASTTLPLTPAPKRSKRDHGSVGINFQQPFIRNEAKDVGVVTFEVPDFGGGIGTRRSEPRTRKPLALRIGATSRLNHAMPSAFGPCAKPPTKSSCAGFPRAANPLRFLGCFGDFSVGIAICGNGARLHPRRNELCHQLRFVFARIKDHVAPVAQA